MRAKREGAGRSVIYIEEKMTMKSNYYSRAMLDRLAKLVRRHEPHRGQPAPRGPRRSPRQAPREALITAGWRHGPHRRPRPSSATHRRGVLVTPEARRPPAAVQHRCTPSATTASIRISITADRAKYKNLPRTPLASLHVTRGGLLRLRGARGRRRAQRRRRGARRRHGRRARRRCTAPWPASTTTGTSSADAMVDRPPRRRPPHAHPRLRHAAQLTRRRSPTAACDRTRSRRASRCRRRRWAPGPCRSACDRSSTRCGTRSVAGGLALDRSRGAWPALASARTAATISPGRSR